METDGGCLGGPQVSGLGLDEVYFDIEGTTFTKALVVVFARLGTMKMRNRASPMHWADVCY
jgi:hypothetical protein